MIRMRTSWQTAKAVRPERIGERSGHAPVAQKIIATKRAAHTQNNETVVDPYNPFEPPSVGARRSGRKWNAAGYMAVTNAVMFVCFVLFRIGQYSSSTLAQMEGYKSYADSCLLIFLITWIIAVCLFVIGAVGRQTKAPIALVTWMFLASSIVLLYAVQMFSGVQVHSK